ncbi:SAM-dependent methyltransferase [Croceicoccus sp. F390]|uniref:SAM-dependent methyltransferase n=2 Tax=Croceicoccus esteveae TaxID=3075597 RepID=A0ABU2ZDI3_9SPHN|nr:SAM-dependent methyltransferase [Croceicoccus sp. F390]MDT0574659.1 SAM-dependent methyltransferase [Croceicoccus sp. F390]
MAHANAHYYATRDPLGRAGDFITAPEISQLFGEMLGGWVADLVLRTAGATAIPRFAYVELGPGRGTLARDALRVIRTAHLAPEVHFIEGSPQLRKLQTQAVPDAIFHDSTATLPDNLPLLIIANEFFDALAVRQLVRTQDGWRERMVALEEERFIPVEGEQPMDAALASVQTDAPVGTIIETVPAAAAIMQDVAMAIARQGGAMLTVDYGYVQTRIGSTLQAVRNHRMVDPFFDPGNADLTAHVDFASLANVAQDAGCVLYGTVQQGVFLNRLGIKERAHALAAANPGQAKSVFSGLERLVDARDRQGMGRLFKVLGFGSPQWPPGAGFSPEENAGGTFA